MGRGAPPGDLAVLRPQRRSQRHASRFRRQTTTGRTVAEAARRVDQVDRPADRSRDPVNVRSRKFTVQARLAGVLVVADVQSNDRSSGPKWRRRFFLLVVAWCVVTVATSFAPVRGFLIAPLHIHESDASGSFAYVMADGPATWE